MTKNKRISYLNRIRYCQNPMARRLYRLIVSKKSNLCVSADVTSVAALIKLANEVGPEICLLKTHIDILRDFTPDFISELKYLANKYQFLIFEDRKFADIGSTVQQQYVGGIYRIASWADIINAHTVSGPGIIQGLEAIGSIKQRGLLLLAEMSSIGSLATGYYTEASIQMATLYPHFVMGFISQGRLIENPGYIHMTPGVQFNKQSEEDNLGQRYISPEQAIIKNASDIIIVGRGIYQARNVSAMAHRYRIAAWEAYLSCIT